MKGTTEPNTTTNSQHNLTNTIENMDPNFLNISNSSCQNTSTIHHSNLQCSMHNKLLSISWWSNLNAVKNVTWQVYIITLSIFSAILMHCTLFPRNSMTMLSNHLSDLQHNGTFLNSSISQCPPPSSPSLFYSCLQSNQHVTSAVSHHNQASINVIPAVL